MTESSVPRDPSEDQKRHTPSPWRDVHLRSAHGDYHQIQTEHRHFPGGLIVATVSDRNPNPREAEANARLIAAAPELLAALKLVQRAIAVHHEAGRDAVIQPDSVVTDTLAEAIAKATGADR